MTVARLAISIDAGLARAVRRAAGKGTTSAWLADAAERKLRAEGLLRAVADTTPCADIFDAVAGPVVRKGRRTRALRIDDAADLALLHAVSRGEFATAGFRHREIRALLFAHAPPDVKRQAAAVTRKLALLRAHGLIQKVPRTHRYQLTERGRLL